MKVTQIVVKEDQGELKEDQEEVQGAIKEVQDQLTNLNPERIPQLRGRRRKGEYRSKGEQVRNLKGVIRGRRKLLRLNQFIMEMTSSMKNLTLNPLKQLVRI